MRLGFFTGHRYRLASCLFWMLACAAAFSQTQSSGLRGRVTDPSGAVIPQSTVTATSASGQKFSAITDKQGVYELKNLAPGSYTVDVLAPGFTEYTAQAG